MGTVLRIGIALCLLLSQTGGLSAFSDSVTIMFDEPTMDMTHTTLHVWFIRPDGTEVKQPTVQIPASSGAGGGSIEYAHTFQGIDGYKWIRVYAITSGSNPDRDSKPSNTFIYTIDRTRPQSPR